MLYTFFTSKSLIADVTFMHILSRQKVRTKYLKNTYPDRKAQYKEVYSRTIEILQRGSILKSNCCLKIHNAHLKVSIANIGIGNYPRLRRIIEVGKCTDLIISSRRQKGNLQLLSSKVCYTKWYSSCSVYSLLSVLNKINLCENLIVLYNVASALWHNTAIRKVDTHNFRRISYEY